MNPIEHVWGFIGRKINQRNPKCQNIDELRTLQHDVALDPIIPPFDFHFRIYKRDLAILTE
jgi:hypothetical protein